MKEKVADMSWFALSIIGVILGLIVLFTKFDFVDTYMTLSEAEDVIEWIAHEEGHTKAYAFSETSNEIKWTKNLAWGAIGVSSASFFVSGAFVLEDKGLLSTDFKKSLDNLDEWRNWGRIIIIGLIIASFVYKYNIEEIFLKEYSEIF